jgi:phosphoribosylanthranilate isomerase
MLPLLKTCGLRDPENILALAALEPDFMGFIFYPPSKRKADPATLLPVLKTLSDDIQKVGVFVNEDEDTILNVARMLDLDVIQLHGDEDPAMGTFLQNEGLQVWKAFGIQSHPDWQHMENWLNSCDAFLFDTASSGYGGSGKVFEHTVLQNYPFKKPFWLSGGIGPDFRTLPDFFNRLPFLGLDINSRFESEPGLKKVEEVEKFIEHWRGESDAHQ